MAVNMNNIGFKVDKLLRKATANALKSPRTVTEQAVGATSPNAGRGRPVQTSIASIAGGALKPQYAATQAEVVADHPVTELSPEVKAMMAKAGQVTSDMLSGVISSDVEAQISRISAENASRGGFGMDSGAARNLTYRDLGRFSADVQAKGIESAKALADFDANWQTQRMQFLNQTRQLDLSAAELKLKDREFKQQLDLNRMKLLSDATTSYYQLAFGYESKKNASQDNLNDLRTATQGVTSMLRGQLGIKTPKGFNK